MSVELGQLKFLKPSAALRELWLLMALNANPRMSQRALATHADLSPSAVNGYLRKFIASGWVKRRAINQRDQLYYLTPEGKKYLANTYFSYLREAFVLFNHAKRRLAERLQSLHDAYGLSRVALYPAGEVAELILNAAPDIPLEVVALVDDDPRKQGTDILGHPVLEPEALKELEIDGIIVATYRYREEILRKLKDLERNDLKVVGI